MNEEPSDKQKQYGLPRGKGRPRAYTEMCTNMLTLPIEVSVKEQLRDLSVRTGIPMTQLCLRAVKFTIACYRAGRVPPPLADLPLLPKSVKCPFCAKKQRQPSKPPSSALSSSHVHDPRD